MRVSPPASLAPPTRSFAPLRRTRETPMPTTLRRSSKRSTSGLTGAVRPRPETPPELPQPTGPRDGSPRRSSTEAAQLLTERLADCIDLRTLVRQARQDVKVASSRRLRE